MKNNEEHRNWDWDKLKKFLVDVENVGYISNYMKFMVENIKNKTDFLDQAYDDVPFSLRVNCIRADVKQVPICEYCKRNFVRYKKKEKQFRTSCSTKCSRKLAGRKTSETMKSFSEEKFNSINEKRKSSLLKNHGADNPMRVPEMRNKHILSLTRNYGVNNPMHSPIVVEKVKEAWKFKTEKEIEDIVKKRIQFYLKKYNKHHQMLVKSIAKKVSDSWKQKTEEEILDITERRTMSSIENHGRTNPAQDYEKYELLNDKEIVKSLYDELGGVAAAEVIGVSDVCFYNYMRKHGISINPMYGKSFAEIEIANFVEELGFGVETGRRDLIKGELDIFIPSKSIAIEYNGIFWHSSLFRNNNYHLTKTRMCEEKGIRLIQIFEDEWIDRKETVKNSIKHRLGVSDTTRVYARKCKVVPVTNKEIAELYNTHHVQGSMNASISYSLKHGDEIVAAMSFKENFGYMELTRFATSCQVVGGFSKLFKHFVRNNPEIESVVSFADRRWSQGNMYYRNGFELVETIRPNYYYVQGQKRVKKQKFRHKYLKDMLPKYDPSLSEKENTENNGIYRIYDCGLLKFEWTRD